SLLYVGIKKRGKCQPAQKTPRIKEPLRAPLDACKRGRANPRHPGSSKSGLINNWNKKRTAYRSKTEERTERGKVVRASGTMISAPRHNRAGKPQSANPYHWMPTRQRRKRCSRRRRPALPDVSAVRRKPAPTGPREPAAMAAAGKRIGKRPRPF